MADSAVNITAGTGTAIDTRTTPAGDHRQVIVLGDETATTVAKVTAQGLAVLPTPATTANRTSPAMTTTVANVLAANTARLSAVIYVETGSTLFLAFGSGATTSSYTVQIPVGATFVVTGYNGLLTGITGVGTSTIRVTELT